MPINEVFLSLNDVEDMIAAFELKYGVSSAEFFRNQEVHQGIPEDDAFQWESLIDHRLALREAYQQVRSAYLSRLSHDSGPVSTGVETLEQLAA